MCLVRVQCLKITILTLFRFAWALFPTQFPRSGASEPRHAHETSVRSPGWSVCLGMLCGRSAVPPGALSRPQHRSAGRERCGPQILTEDTRRYCSLIRLGPNIRIFRSYSNSKIICVNSRNSRKFLLNTVASALRTFLAELLRRINFCCCITFVTLFPEHIKQQLESCEYSRSAVLS